MRITDDTKLERKAIMFCDGEDGYFMQQHQIIADGNDTGVTMLVTGNLGQDNTNRTFEFGGQDFNKIQDAFRAAGHDVVSSNGSHNRTPRSLRRSAFMAWLDFS